MGEVEAENKRVWKFITEREIEAPERFRAIQSYRCARRPPIRGTGALRSALRQLPQRAAIAVPITAVCLGAALPNADHPSAEDAG